MDDSNEYETGTPRLTVYALADLARESELAEGTAVVIDVLRATTTAIRALANGCLEVIAVEEIADALALARDLSRRGPVLLGGERRGLPIPGFDLGNSPHEYTQEVCTGRRLVLTTTNGTRAMVRAARAKITLLASFHNVSAVTRLLDYLGGPTFLLCSGTEGRVSLEDVLCAGAIVERGGDRFQMDDMGWIARAAWQQWRENLAEALQLGTGGRKLVSLGLERDVIEAARVDICDVVPVAQGGKPAFVAWRDTPRASKNCWSQGPGFS